jgi:hypothetical protein
MPKSAKSEGSSEALQLSNDDCDLVCGACLLELFCEDHDFIGVPQGCPHLFHWDCLDNWAQIQNTCPQCKNRFRVAGKYNASTRDFVECVKFRKRDRVGEVADEAPDEDVPVDLCEKCKEPGVDEDLILCDGMDFTCNAMYHYKCVGFSHVPRGLWFCDSCIQKGYIPEELKTKTASHSAAPISPPKKKRSKLTPSISPPPYTMPPPNLFPRSLVVLDGASRRPPEQSSRIPRNLVQPDFNLPAVQPSGVSAPSMSVFARFRQRRLELKKNNGTF